jgi:hypothetical protein
MANGSDPACLWYWGDWAGGTSRFSRHLKGCYMDLLFAQFNGGPLTLDEVKTVLGSDFGPSWPTLQKKFKTTPDGHFFNARLQKEKDKRSSFVESRQKNLNPHMVDHMDNGNRNETEDGKRKEGAGRKPKPKAVPTPAPAATDAMHLDWEKWGNLIVDGLDHLWDVFGRRKVNRAEMDSFLSVGVRNGWVMETQMSFRYALRGFDVKNGTTTGKTGGADLTNL